MPGVRVPLACENGGGIGFQLQFHGSVPDVPWQCDWHADVMNVNATGSMVDDGWCNQCSELAAQNNSLGDGRDNGSSLEACMAFQNMHYVVVDLMDSLENVYIVPEDDCCVDGFDGVWHEACN